jgi:hypothetical protein
MVRYHYCHPKALVNLNSVDKNHFSMENKLDNNSGAELALPAVDSAVAPSMGQGGGNQPEVQQQKHSEGEPQQKRVQREENEEEQPQQQLQQHQMQQPPMMYMPPMPMGFHPMMFGYPQPPGIPPHDTGNNAPQASSTATPNSKGAAVIKEGKEGDAAMIMPSNNKNQHQQQQQQPQMMPAYNPYMMMNFYYAAAASAAAAATSGGGGTGRTGEGFPAFMINNPVTAGPPTPYSRGISLELSIDSEMLSDYQLLVRQQLELFEAGPQDLESNTQGRKKQVVAGQVGLRCRHCAGYPTRARGRGSVYFPSKLSGTFVYYLSHVVLVVSSLFWPCCVLALIHPCFLHHVVCNA